MGNTAAYVTIAGISLFLIALAIKKKKMETSDKILIGLGGTAALLNTIAAINEISKEQTPAESGTWMVRTPCNSCTR